MTQILLKISLLLIASNLSMQIFPAALAAKKSKFEVGLEKALKELNTINYKLVKFLGDFRPKLPLNQSNELLQAFGYLNEIEGLRYAIHGAYDIALKALKDEMDIEKKKTKDCEEFLSKYNVIQKEGAQPPEFDKWGKDEDPKEQGPIVALAAPSDKSPVGEKGAVEKEKMGPEVAAAAEPKGDLFAAVLSNEPANVFKVINTMNLEQINQKNDKNQTALDIAHDVARNGESLQVRENAGVIIHNIRQRIELLTSKQR